MQAVEGPYIAAIRYEKDRYITAQSQAFATAGQLEQRLLDFHRAAMISLAMYYQGTAIKVALKETLEAVDIKKKTDWDKLWLYLLRKWMADYGFQAARETADTTYADMQHIVDEALSPDIEFNPVAVATALLSARDLTPFRAETIALTEVHNAMMYASLEGAGVVSRDNDVQLTKKWNVVMDGRERPAHGAMFNAPAIPLNDDFTVGGMKMSRPGDPRGGAKNVIKCRCVLSYAPVDD